MSTAPRFGKYEIRRELGRGAMGIVFEAFDPLIGRSVALKVLQQPQLRGDPALAAEVRQRFEREARVAGQLNHVNVVAVYDYGVQPDGDGGEPVQFIAMELVQGRDLRAELDSGRRFSLAEVGRLMSGLLDAMGHAHDKGVVHRDIKPANVMLCHPGDVVKVTDFGIARMDDSDLTRTGAVLGTMAYMAPEQLLGEPLDARTDLYACGVLLFEMLTGKPPFSGSAASIIQKVLNRPPPAPSSITVGLPRGLDDVLRRALAKKPAGRFADAGTFARALAQALGGRDDDATRQRLPAQRPRWRPSVGAVVFGSGGAAAAAALVWWLGPGESGRVSADRFAGGDRAQVAEAASAVPAAAVAVFAAAASRLAASSPSPVVLSDREIEQAAWNEARRIDTVATYAVFLREYPKGAFARHARIRIAALAPRTSPPVAPSSSPVATIVTSASPVLAPEPGPRPAPPSTSAARTEARTAASSVVSTPPTIKSAAPLVTPSPSATMQAALLPRSASAADVRPRKDSGLDSCLAHAAADKDCPLLLGDAYRRGRGFTRDSAEAVRWYRLGAMNGDSRAQLALGIAYATGDGVESNENEAARWVRRAADQGLAAAQNRLGYYYENGVGLPSNHVLAASWYALASEQGLTEGQANLGRMYVFGRGVFRDRSKGISLLEQAAAKGNAHAHYQLGRLREKGDGLAKDERAAVRHYRTGLSGQLSISQAELDRIRAFVRDHP